MIALSAIQVRPALLRDVRPPGVLLKTDDYGAPFLVVGDATDPDVIMLGGEYKFQSFKRSGGANYYGLAIEDVIFEIDIESRF